MAVELACLQLAVFDIISRALPRVSLLFSYMGKMMIRLQRIYNFRLFHAIILPILDVYGLYFTLLYNFWD